MIRRPTRSTLFPSTPLVRSALREQLAARGRQAGWTSDADEIVVTSGARQALGLTTRALLDPGDVAVVESPSFIGTLGRSEEQRLNSSHANISYAVFCL